MSSLSHSLIGQRPMSRFQLAVVVVGVCLNMLDGFDILAMSFAATGVKTDWHLAGTELGVLFSAGLIGMGIGSLILGPCADRFGRRRVVLFAVALAGLGMLGSAFARGFSELVALRVITGFGVGGTIACVSVVVSEFASDKGREAALAAYATGYSIGATLGATLTRFAIPVYGWRSAFAIGGTMTLLLLPLAAWRLPESLDFLVTRRPVRALERANRLLERMHLARLAELPAAGAARGSPLSEVKLVLTPMTALVWTGFFCTMAAFYFIVSWTPRLLAESGLGSSQSLNGAVILNFGGIVGCGGFAIAAAFRNARRLLVGSLAGSVVLIVLFGLVIGELTPALWTALFLGIISNAAMAGLYAVGPPLYPTAVRATGMGWAIGMGRIGAILAPMLSGKLLDIGWQPRQLYYLYAAAFAIAGVAFLAIRRDPAESAPA